MINIRPIELPSDYVLIDEMVLREDDTLELLGGGLGLDMTSGLRACVELSENTAIAELDGHALCVFGYSVHNGILVPWMLGTDELKEHPKVVWQVSLGIMKYLMSLGYPMMNFVGTHSKTAQRWLERLGFTIDRSHEFPSPHLPQISYFQFYWKPTEVS